MNNNKVMLIYGFHIGEIAKLDKLIEAKEIPGYKKISSEMSKMKISSILEGYKFEIYNGNLPKEKLVVFNNFNDVEINVAIKCLKEISKGIIMAVVTPTSIDWTFEYLLEHLIEERQWYKDNNPTK
ncbi:MAG: DUF3783 domain-containing protein [Clostridiaceae bacterium]|nr:DUF3783 domain-containing protein [Clostridiaceae bacterium]